MVQKQVKCRFFMTGKMYTAIQQNKNEDQLEEKHLLCHTCIFLFSQ